MSGSRITIAEEERLPNVHPGAILREDFLIGSDISVDEVVGDAGVDRTRLLAILQERERVDAETDLRLARYFGMSDGFFLGLQTDHDLEEAWRARGRDLDRIVPRAA